MQYITDRMIDGFYGEYERPRRLGEVMSRSFMDDILEEEDSVFYDEGEDEDGTSFDL